MEGGGITAITTTDRIFLQFPPLSISRKLIFKKISRSVEHGYFDYNSRPLDDSLAGSIGQSRDERSHQPGRNEYNNNRNVLARCIFVIRFTILTSDAMTSS